MATNKYGFAASSATASAQQDLQHYQEVIASPAFQAELQQVMSQPGPLIGSGIFGTPKSSNGSPLSRLLDKYGLSKTPDGYAFNPTSGQLEVDNGNWGDFAKYGLPLLAGPILAAALAPAGAAAGAGAAGADPGVIGTAGNLATAPGVFATAPGVVTPVAAGAAAGTTAAELGPSTAANIYGTAAAETAPAAIAAPAATPGGQVAAASGTKWLSPLLQSIVPTAGAVVGGIVQSNAIKDAAKTQAASTQAALDFEKQAYSDLVGRLTPYINAGDSSVARQNAVLGLPSPAASAPAPTSPSTTATTAGGPVPAGMVRLKAPTGEIGVVPQAQQAFYLQHGAVPA